MKPYKKNISILSLMLMLILCFSVSCREDGADYDNDGSKDANRITINISLEEVTEAKNTLKAFVNGASSTRFDYNTLNNLNVVVYVNNDAASPYVYYFDATTHPSGFNLPMSGGTSSLSIYTTTAFSEVYLVGNYGSAISRSSVLTPNDLKSLSVTLPMNNAPDKSVMFAKAIDQGTTNGDGSKVFNAALERNMAMVTVSLHGKNLRTGVSIKPTRISINNVPATMTLGQPNNKIINSTGLRAGYSLVDSNWPILNNVDSLIGYNTHTSTGTLALFAFENMQGTDNSIANQLNKKSDINQMPFATYVTVEAQYSYGTLKGDITYRFCLGTDITQNYDLIRNKHYILSLYLSDWGGAQEGGRISANTLVTGTGQGVNWRVLMNMYDYGFSQTDFNFDGHMSTGVLPVSGSSKFFNFQYNPAINTANVSEHWILTTKANNTWIPMETGSADAIKNNQFTYFIKPWRYTDPGFPKLDTDKQYRECTITIVKSNGTSPQTVVFRQWAPIRLSSTLYMERFDEGKTTLASNLAWGYQGTTTLPSGFVYWTAGGADNQQGLVNTQRLGTTSPAATYTLRKGGFDIAGVSPSILASQFKPAAYYLPSSAEMDTVASFVVDIFNPAYTGMDVVDKTIDYWSSSANNAGGTYYWNKTTAVRTLTTTRTGIKKVRAVYRPSKDTP
ncbi:DUF4906 domain-containing protein [Dysgonomonas sp. ZJ279]|uniref:DUF4906 domain-containing protein n=1 Tax=Dysgonomonas sp. ZJ279 TaxID=2709796 RepID=UPI0013EAEFE5|nr:DUF4906 domain-containing protein [Dysgonomonas sp. ZJ279]